MEAIRKGVWAFVDELRGQNKDVREEVKLAGEQAAARE
jgi:hypothetical protein